jgi:hypothetical protein
MKMYSRCGVNCKHTVNQVFLLTSPYLSLFSLPTKEKLFA